MNTLEQTAESMCIFIKAVTMEHASVNEDYVHKGLAWKRKREGMKLILTQLFRRN